MPAMLQCHRKIAECERLYMSRTKRGLARPWYSVCELILSNHRLDCDGECSSRVLVFGRGPALLLALLR